MPKFSQLTEEEVAARKSRNTNTEAIKEYVEGLRGLQPGTWIRLQLEGDDSQRTVKRRASMAATSLGMKIRWKRAGADDKDVVFEVTEARPPEGAPATPIGPDGKPVPNAEKTIGAGSPPGRN